MALTPREAGLLAVLGAVVAYALFGRRASR